VLVRRLEALEAGATIDTVVFDKTGTLTRDRMAVTGIRTREGVSDAEALALAAALAGHSLHPVSRALVAAHAGPLPETSGVKEHAGEGVEGCVRFGDAPRTLRLGSASFCGDLAEAPRAGQVHLADERGWLASFDLDEALRDDAQPAVGALQRESLRVELLSGDRAGAVRRLATRAGIEFGFGGRTPEDKLLHVRGLQRRGHRVAMVGDGMNDGPVLACADLSIAMGQGVPVAQARSDFIVLGGQLAAVPMLLAQSRRTRRIVRQNLGWAFAYNLVCVPLALAGLMPPWLAGLGMAASSLFVVLNAARLARIPTPR
jgi:Cu2+-exporting ATPase